MDEKGHFNSHDGWLCPVTGLSALVTVNSLNAHTPELSTVTCSVIGGMVISSNWLECAGCRE